MEEKKKINYSLRDYQENTTNNIREIFSREADAYNRFAGVVLPTGGGKSFVAIEEILEVYNDENGKISFKNPSEIADFDRTKQINDTPILYIAPSHEILSQIKLHIVKNVLLSINGLENMSVSEINSMIEEEFPYLNFQGMDSEVTDSSSASEKKSAILRQISPEQITKMVRRAFPGLDLKCYAGVKEKGKTVENDELLTEVDGDKYSLIVLDEAHRTGSNTWGENIENLIKKTTKSKILAITATPKRTDSSQKDMMKELAQMVYGETVLPDVYMASEIVVLDAMRDGIVTSPEIVDFPPSLINSEEYKTLREKYSSSRGKNRAELKEILAQMEAISGVDPKKKIDEDKLIGETLQRNLKNKNGKYIAFIPSNKSKGEDKTETQDYFEGWKARIRKQFENVLDENGNPVKVEVSFVTSEVKVQSPSDNSRVLKNFEDSSNTTGGVKVLIAIDKLNEGVHVDGIDGIFMYRPIGKESSTLFLQQSGRCISSMDPKMVTTEDFMRKSREQIFDFSGNFLKQINNNIAGRVSRRYDLEKIQELSNWIKENGIPDINSNVLKEARYAIALKRLYEKYEAYSQGEIPVTLGDTDKIKQIVSIGTDMKLWEMKFSERTELPSEDEITGDKFLRLTDSQNNFMELYNRGNSLSRQSEPGDIRVKKLINILKVLKMRKPDIDIPAGLLVKNTKGKDEMSSDCESISLDDFLSKNFEQSEIERILIEFEDLDRVGANNRREVYHRGEEYDLGKEIAFARGRLFTDGATYLKTNSPSVFSEYNAHELINLGILDIQMVETGLLELYGIKNATNKNGFLNLNSVPAKERKYLPDFGIIEELDEVSVITGSKFIDGRDIDGYDENGYDEFGFDRYGFDKDKTHHKITGEPYDDRGFMWDQEKEKWINSKTKTEYDVLGFNIDGIDENGFERPVGLQVREDGSYGYTPRLWHKKKEDGTYEKLGRLLNPETELDAHNFRYEHGIKWGYHGKIGKKSTAGQFWSNGATTQNPQSKEDFYSYSDLDIDGYNEYGFKKIQVGKNIAYVHRDTSTTYDKGGNILEIKNGKVIGLKMHPAIRNTKFIAKSIISDGKTMEEVYEIAAESLKCTIPEAQRKLGNAIRNFVQMSRMSPEILENGYFQKLFSKEGPKEKGKRIDLFFETCPEIKDRIIESITETDRRIHLLDESLKEIETKGQVAVDAKDMGTAFRLYNESQEIKERKQEMNDKKEFFKDFDER